MRIQHAEQHQNPQQDGGGVKKDAEVANTNQVTCSFCGGSAIHMGGPIYVAPIHEATFVQKLLDRLEQHILNYSHHRYINQRLWTSIDCPYVFFLVGLTQNSSLVTSLVLVIAKKNIRD